nr:uncharacterized protein LOC109174250 [Ipomoea batatas]
MAKALCKFQYELDKGVLVKRNGGTWRRKQRSVVEACSLGLGNFPSCEEIALLSESDELNKFCNLGYRARFILRLAQHIFIPCDTETISSLEGDLHVYVLSAKHGKEIALLL